jgi:hypothetical protein
MLARHARAPGAPCPRAWRAKRARLAGLRRGARGDSLERVLVQTKRSAMRLKSSIWVAAYIRRCGVEGIFAALRRHGAEEAGAIFIKVNRLDGTADVYGPAPQSAFDQAQPSDRAFAPGLELQPAPEADVEAYLTRQMRFDPDLWIVETEDRAGRHFLDQVVR